MKGKSRSKTKDRNSRVIQVSINGTRLKMFEAEKAREEHDNDSALGRDLITEALNARLEKRNRPNPFFKRD